MYSNNGIGNRTLNFARMHLDFGLPTRREYCGEKEKKLLIKTHVMEVVRRSRNAVPNFARAEIRRHLTADLADDPHLPKDEVIRSPIISSQLLENDSEKLSSLVNITRGRASSVLLLDRV